MRSIWKGSISFGLVSIPIKVVSATENHSVSFRQIHTADGGRIRYRKVCELEEKEVPKDEVGKAFEAGDGTAVQLTEEDMAALPLPTARTVEILAFVPAEHIDPIQLDRSYYLAVDGQSASKPYALLREALERSGKVAVAKLAMRGRESLGMLRVYEDVLVLHTMLWPDEIRPASGVAPSEQVTVRDAELDLADTLMETLGELDWDTLHDEYREAVEQLVAAKAQGADLSEERARAGARGAEGKVVDLMTVLESSVQAAKESRGESAGQGDATVHELSDKRASRTDGPGEGKGAKKSAAGKKAAASGSSGPAKKTAAKKPAAAKASASKKASSGQQTGSGKKTAKKTAAKKTARAPRKSA